MPHCISGQSHLIWITHGLPAPARILAGRPIPKNQRSRLTEAAGCARALFIEEFSYHDHCSGCCGALHGPHARHRRHILQKGDGRRGLLSFRALPAYDRAGFHLRGNMDRRVLHARQVRSCLFKRHLRHFPDDWLIHSLLYLHCFCRPHPQNRCGTRHKLNSRTVSEAFRENHFFDCCAGHRMDNDMHDGHPAYRFLKGA